MSVMSCFASGMESEIRLTGFFCLLLFDCLIKESAIKKTEALSVSPFCPVCLFPLSREICIIPDKKAATMFRLYGMRKRVRDYCRD